MGFLSYISRKDNEFYLENVIEKNHEFPRTYLIPSSDDMDKLKVGDTVKLIFVMDKPQSDGCRAEKMWVIIDSIEDDVFKGTLNNDPYYLKKIKSGDMIDFRTENIASVLREKSSLDENKFAIITKKALDMRQVNWAVKSEEIDNSQDSGWQLFYGDEDDDYLEDLTNAKLLSFGEVLNFEPLLEKAFTGDGNAYEYSVSDNKFIEVIE